MTQAFIDHRTKYRDIIDKQMPLDGRAPGAAPPMTADEMADLETFLNTLTDHYKKPVTNTVSKAP